MFRIVILIIVASFFAACSSTIVPNHKGLTKSFREPYMLDSAFYKETVRHKVIEAATLRMKNQFANAVVELQELYLYEKEPAIAYSISQNLLSLKKVDLAKYYIEQALDADSAFVPAYELLIDIYLAQRDVNNAVEVITFLQQIDYKVERDFDLAFAYEFTNPIKAVDTYEKLYEKFPEERLYNRLINLYDKTGQPNKKIYLLKDKFLSNPKNTDITKQLFSYWIKHGDINEVLTFAFDNEDKIESKDLVLIYGASSQSILDGADCNPNILDTLLSKFDIRYADDWQLYLQGFYLAANNSLENQEKQFLALIERFSDKKQDVFLELAVFFQTKNRYIDAENLLKHYYTNFSDDFRYPFLLGMNSFYQTKDTEALSWLNKAIKINSKSADVWVNIGIIYDRNKKLDSAALAYKSALEINPKHAMANNNYAYSLASSNTKLRDALEMVQISLQQEPKNSAFLDTYGWILFKLGKHEIALEQTIKAIDAGGAGAEVYEHLGDIYKEIGKIDDAKRAYEVGLKIYPNNAELIQKLKKVS